ncbi:MAG: HlyD family secretion protein, partial [candidate division KSB1 bacterium]|nr:HlyD family secretion protein [candidate division KSB1 bacterium]
MMKRKLFRQTHNFNWYIILWLAALATVFYLTQNWFINKKFIGIVERRSHPLGVQEPGRINQLLVNIGDEVKKDQILAILDISDLKTTLDQLQEELTSFQRLKRAQRDRYSIQVHRMALQLENEAADLVERLSLIRSKSTELAGLNAEIERLQQAEQAGLGHSRDLADLVLQRDALATYLNELNKDLAFQTQKLERTRKSRQMLSAADIDSMAESLLWEQMEYAESLRRLVAETDHRINLRSVIAPCDGFVTEILARPGDVIDAFLPIITVEEARPTYLDVYIPEQSNLTLQAGMTAEIYSSRSRKYNTTGVVTFIHPEFTRASERLSFRGQIFWARKVRVELPKDHQLLPGEVVNVRILKKNAANQSASLIASEKKSADANPLQKKAPSVIPMEVPQNLWNKTRFEPSGVAWLPDIQKFLIVSDDTGIQDALNDHAPYLFLMDESGNVAEAPMPLLGIEKINDLEAIAPAGNGAFYLISSQNISKKNKRPGSRELIIKVQRDGEKLVVQGQVQFLSLLLNSFSLPELRALGLEKFEADGQPVLNIEGAAFHDHALYLGLKEPVTNKGAIIWKLENVDDIFTSRKL